MLLQIVNPFGLVPFVVHTSILHPACVMDKLAIPAVRTNLIQQTAAPRGMRLPLSGSRTVKVSAVAASERASIRTNAGL